MTDLKIRHDGLPQGGDGSLAENGGGAVLAGEAQGAEIGFGLGVVGYSDEAALATGAVPAVAAVGAIAATVSVGRAKTAGAAVTAATAFSTGACGAAIGFHGEGASLGIDEIETLLACEGDADFEKRMIGGRLGCGKGRGGRGRGTGRQSGRAVWRAVHGHEDLHWRRVRSIAAILAVRAIGAAGAVAAGRGVIRVRGAWAAAGAVAAIETTGTAHAGTAGEIGEERDVVAKRNIELGAEIGMARDGNGNVAGFAVTDSGIASERDDAFLVGFDDSGGEREVLPLNFAAALAFGAQDFAVGLRDGDNERGLLSGSEVRTFRQGGVDGGDRDLGEVDAHAEFDSHGAAARFSEESG